MIIKELFKKYRTIGLVGNPGEAKSSLVLGELIEIKKEVSIAVYVLGAEPCLFPFLEKNGINILESKEDILDLKIRDSVIFIEEFGDVFDVETQGHQLDKIKRFFNRIDHLNNFVVVSSARGGFWNKLLDGLIKCFLVKKIDFQNLVNGTNLKRKIKGIIDNTSDYRLDIPKNTFYVITDEEIVKKMTFEYNKNLDSKKENVNPFTKEDRGKK
jgi:acylphosphatase